MPRPFPIMVRPIVFISPIHLINGRSTHLLRGWGEVSLVLSWVHEFRGMLFFLGRRENYIRLELRTSSRYKHSGILYIYPETDFHLNYTHAVNSSKSQIQTCMTLRMDDRVGKHLVKSPENRCPTNDNQHSCRWSWETSFFFGVSSFIFLLPPK